MKKHKGKIIAGSIIILFHMLIGLYFWNDLADTMAVHWNANGQPDGFASKLFAVVGMPLLLLALYWVCIFVTEKDKKNASQNDKIMALMLWIVPVISLIASAMVYTYALVGEVYDISKAMFVILGAIFAITGNYLPKCTPSYTIGIKLPWTLASEQNWHATHRLGGKLWVIGGIMVAACGLVPSKMTFTFSFVIMVIMVAVPVIYSYLYSKKNGQ